MKVYIVTEFLWGSDGKAIRGVFSTLELANEFIGDNPDLMMDDIWIVDVGEVYE